MVMQRQPSRVPLRLCTLPCIQSPEQQTRRGGLFTKLSSNSCLIPFISRLQKFKNPCWCREHPCLLGIMQHRSSFKRAVWDTQWKWLSWQSKYIKPIGFEGERLWNFPLTSWYRNSLADCGNVDLPSWIIFRHAEHDRAATNLTNLHKTTRLHGKQKHGILNHQIQ